MNDADQANSDDQAADSGTDPAAGDLAALDADAGTDPDADPAGTDESEPDTFTREYVVELRREAASHRAKAHAAEERADTLARTLWVERVAALSLLADPTDLPYNADVLDNPDEIRRQAEELLAAKPHLRTRRITARAGQGERGHGDAEVSLAGMLRGRA